MVKFKGSCDSRDLDSNAQFYYEKLVKTINENLLFDVDIIDTIECLDNLIDAIREDYEKR